MNASKSNITKEHQQAFEALRDENYNNFALFSCFVNGKPASAIVVVNNTNANDVIVTPLFVSITPEMKLTDHDGNRLIPR